MLAATDGQCGNSVKSAADATAGSADAATANVDTFSAFFAAASKQSPFGRTRRQEGPTTASPPRRARIWQRRHSSQSAPLPHFAAGKRRSRLRARWFRRRRTRWLAHLEPRADERSLVDADARRAHDAVDAAVGSDLDALFRGHLAD